MSLDQTSLISTRPAVPALHSGDSTNTSGAKYSNRFSSLSLQVTISRVLNCFFLKQTGKGIRKIIKMNQALMLSKSNFRNYYWVKLRLATVEQELKFYTCHLKGDSRLDQPFVLFKLNCWKCAVENWHAVNNRKILFSRCQRVELKQKCCFESNHDVRKEMAQYESIDINRFQIYVIYEK